MREKIFKTVRRIMSVDFPFATDKLVFINTDKTVSLLIGKTMLDKQVMLYVYAQLWDGSSWYPDKMLLCKNTDDILKHLNTWLKQHTGRRAA